MNAAQFHSYEVPGVIRFIETESRGWARWLMTVIPALWEAEVAVSQNHAIAWATRVKPSQKKNCILMKDT